MIVFARCADHLELEGCDTLIFTSKQAVKTAEAIDPSWKRYDTVAVGSATKRQIEALGGRVVWMPENFYGEALAEGVKERFQARTFLYLRPKEVSFDTKRHLEQAGIAIKEQVIYETRCRAYAPSDAPEEGSVVIFTSPSTIRCFLHNFTWKKSYIAVVIGKATLTHLPEGASAYVADTPTIDACIAKAREILRESNAN